MGSKHDVLTQLELDAYRMDPDILQAIHQTLLADDSDGDRHKINILDWGCGRGRSVAKLREAGFNAFGVDIDERTRRNGYPLFTERGLDPSEVLLGTDELSSFQTGYFHCIFSEQVLEHVMDLSAIFAEMSRLTAPGGIGLHRFPGSRNIIEEHINMPLVHWLPKGRGRQLAIALCVALGRTPMQQWPETSGKAFWPTIDTYYRYLNEKTYYRNIDEIHASATAAGFELGHRSMGSRWEGRQSWIPEFLRRNGFPQASLFLGLYKA